MFNCNDISKIKNDSLKKLMELRCDRLDEGGKTEQAISFNFNRIMLLLLSVIMTIIFINYKDDFNLQY
jgi:hypothetical protein